jgi:hypothetical protein
MEENDEHEGIWKVAPLPGDLGLQGDYSGKIFEPGVI